MPFGYEESQILTVKGIPVGLVGINALEAGAPDQLQEELAKVKERGARLTVVFSTGAVNWRPVRTRIRCGWPTWPWTRERTWCWGPIPM